MNSGSAVDPRIPVTFGARHPAPDEALLVEHGLDPGSIGERAQARFAAAPAHPAACACCVGRDPAASALAALFVARARGTVPFFHRLRVLAGPAGEAMVRRCLDQDVLARARYRIG